MDVVAEQKIDVDIIAIKKDLIKKAWISVYDMVNERKSKAIIHGNKIEYEGLVLVPYLHMTCDYYRDGTINNWSCTNVGCYIESPEDFVNLFEEMRKVRRAAIEKALCVKSICFKNEQCLNMIKMENYIEYVLNALIYEIDSLRSGKCLDSFEAMKKDLDEKALTVDSFIEMFKVYNKKDVKD